VTSRKEFVMKSQTLSLLALTVFSLAACSSKDASAPAAVSPAPSAATPAASGNATADQVARESRGQVKCPAKTPPGRAGGAPVDDVLGVRPGMPYEQAANVVLCSDDLMVLTESDRGFDIQTYGQKIRQGFSARFAEPRVQKSSREIMQEMQDDMLARSGNAVRPDDMKPGQSKWYVTTMGVPGQEKVIAAAREEWFAAGKNPTVSSVEQALVAKYGAPTARTSSGNQVIVTWAYDPLGRPITETSPLRYKCQGVSDPDGGTNFSPDCGLVVAGQVHALPDNPSLAQFFQVGVIDQATGYDAITGTERALQSIDSQRQAREVQDAAKNADAPRL
jgi:hypothetical protein